MNMKKYILSSIILLLAAVNTAWGQNVAKIGDQEYATLKDAFDAAIAANATKTITLLADCAVTSTITVGNGKSLTLDLAGYTVTSTIGTTFKVTKGTLTVKDNGATKGGIEVSGEAFRVDSRESGVTSAYGATLNINSGVNVTSSDDACVFIRGYATVSTSGNLTSNGQYATIQGNGSDQATVCNVTISGGSVTASQSSAVYFPQHGTLTVSGGTVTGYESGIAIKSGTLNVTGGTIHCTGPDSTPTTSWSDGVNASGAAIQIESNNGYGNVSVSISGTPTITSNNGVAVYEYKDNATTDTKLNSMTITGGTFTGGTGKQPLMLSQEAATAKAAAVSGGSFSAPINAAYCAVGYTPVTEPDASGMYGVTLGQNVCKIGDTPYTSFADAVAAANGTEIIVLLTNIDDPYTMSVGQTIKVQKAGFNVTMIAPAGKYAVNASTSSGVTTYTVIDAVASITKGNPAVTTYYNTLSAAYSAAATGDEVVVEADISAGGAQSAVVSTSTNKTVTLNLNGHTVENKGGGTVLSVSGSSTNLSVMNIVGPGTLTTTGTAIKAGARANVTVDANVTINGNRGIEVAGGQTTLTTEGTINGTEAGIFIAGAGTSYENKILNVTGGSISGQYGIYSSQAATVNISAGTITGTAAAVALNGYCNPNWSDSENDKEKILMNVTGGTIAGTGDGWAIATTGNANDGNYEINISDGTVTADNCAIYHCNDGVLNVSGGTITGSTAIYQKSGTMNISGGTITGNGAATAYSYNGNGANATGDAVVIDNCDYPGGAPSASITGGTFISTNAQPIGSYSYGDSNDPIAGFVSGGTFSSPVPADYCAEGYTPKDNGNGTYTVESIYAAKIGGVNYATLQAAINAAVTASITDSGEEIIVELLKDVTDGTGLALFNDAKGDYPAANDANVKIDFGGHTYTVVGPAVGSTNTQNQVLHFEEGNTITLTNGTINMTTDANALAGFEIFMQNYGTLIIDDMTIDGTGIAVATYSDPKYQAYPEWYNTEKPQFNFNTAGSSVIRNSTITMPGALGIDDAAALTIEDDAVINVSAIATKGTDDRYSSATATVTVENGAKFKLTDTSNAAAFETLLNANGQSLGTAVNGVYTVETATFVASITAGGTTTNYTTLQAAIDAVTDGGTITLLADVATPRYNLETKSFTVNLNGKTLSSTDTTDDGIIFCPKNGKTITIDGTTASSKVVGTIMLTSNQVGHIVINGGTYENNLYTPIYVNGNASNTSTVSITDATVIGNRIDTDSDVETGFGMYLAGPATVTVTNTNVTAVRTGIEVRAGSLTVDGGSITSTATSFNENANGNGGTIIGAAVAISQHNTNKAITVNLNSGTYSGCYAVYEHDVQSTTAGEQVAINITGGDYTGTSGTAIMIKDVDTPTATVPVTAAISGGTFNSAVPNNYCATNYVPAGPFANGKYSVELNNATSINEATITVSVESATYIGSAITPIVTVKNGDTPLVKDTDYTILFDGTYTNAKTYNNAIIITGIGNYRDTRKSNFVISPRNINDVTVSGNTKVYTEAGYTVDDIKASIVLKYTYNTTTKQLEAGETKDYTITVDDTKTYKTPGTYAGVITLTAVEGEGKNYTGSRTVDFMIGNATDIANCDITVPTIIYNGKEQLPAANVTVKNGNTTLTNNADYEISFANGSNFTNAGTTQITITGKGSSYYGSKTVNYTIERRDIATCSINNSTLFGDGSVKDPAAIVTITYNNGTETLNLVKATENALNDYTITVSAGYVYQEPRTYTGALTITGNGNYKGTVTKDFVINNNDNPALNLATALVTSTAIYNGAQQVPSANNVVVKIANQVVDPTNYVVTYTGEAADYKDAKTYAHAVVITATGSAYYGKLTADYVIAKRDMLNVVAAETAEMKWTGNPITPNINTDDNKNISLTLTTGPDGNQVVYPLVAADYTYTTQPAVIQEPGLYTFTFEGRGNFTGTKTLQNVRVLKNMDTQGGNIKLDLADSRIILPATIPPATESAKITAADITVKDGATVLTQGVDYSATIYSKVTEDDQHNFTFNDADIVAEIQNDPDNGKDDGIYWLKITGLNNSYEQSKTLKFYVLKEYYEWNRNSASISSNYSIHLTDAQNASVGALVVNNTTDPVTVENCNAVATNLATLTIEPTMNITLKDGQGSGSKSETITVKITDIEPNAFDGCSSLSSLDASKLVGFTPNSLNRNSKGTTFYGIAKQALIYLNGTTFKGENYVYTPDPNPSDNSQYFCELFKIYDDFSGSQTGFTGNDYRWDLISQHGFTAYTIENMRQFAEGRHYTVYLPYSIPIPKNVKAYTLDATSDKLFGFKEVGTGTLEAYTPYVLIPTTSGQLLSTINAEVPSISSGTQSNPTQAGNYTLYGTMRYMEGGDAVDKYIMQYNNGNPTWKKITSNSSYSNGACILPMRAYIMSNTSGSREFFEVIFTNIDGTTLTFDKLRFDDDAIYDLSGRKVQNVEHGHTYIINGKKIMIK